ncbi:MAG: hypothetical protein BGO67_12370 [Alphaproteobacteria bacterium 41-28]|nr:MAG: hypothetical protein BGO67_12370 [Alphaproteobacteria bacterium 41-28]
MKNSIVRSPLSWYLTGVLFVILISYLAIEYILFEKRYVNSVLKEAQQFENKFSYTIDCYKEVLEKISSEFKAKNIFTNKEEIADTLKKAYVYGIENIDKEAIRISGVNWIGEDISFPIGRLGELKNKINLQQDYLSRLKKNNKSMEISGGMLLNIPSSPYIINVGVGVRDNEETYRGFLNVRINMEALVERLRLIFAEENHEFILFDKGSQIIASSISLSSKEIKQIKGMMPTGKIDENFFKNRGLESFSYPFIVHSNKIFYYLYILYSKRQFYILFLKLIGLQTCLLFIFLLSSILFSLFYHRRVMKRVVHINREKNRENIELLKQQRQLESYVKSSEEAERAGRKFQFEINHRVSHSLSEIIYVGNCLFKRINETEQLEENADDLMEIFEKAIMHSRYSCVKSEVTSVDLNRVLEEASTILLKKTLKKEILIKKRIKGKIGNLISDELAVKQVVINLLNRAIQNSPKGGIIELSLSSDKEQFFLECKDYGYVLDQQVKQENLQKEKGDSVDCMFLEWHDLEKLVNLLGGELKAHYEVYKGNDLILKLPMQSLGRKKSGETTQPNLGNNVIPFSYIKKDGTL